MIACSSLKVIRIVAVERIDPGEELLILLSLAQSETEEIVVIHFFHSLQHHCSEVDIRNCDNLMTLTVNSLAPPLTIFSERDSVNAFPRPIVSCVEKQIALCLVEVIRAFLIVASICNGEIL